MFENHLIYPGTDYTVGTAYPPIRVFDGSFDHELCRLPPTTSNTVPKAVLSMLSANGTIYLTTFDSGTSSADWSGRVFRLDLDSGVLTPIGDPFTGGEMPTALAWHMGRLWVGTNNGIGTVGKVYYFRPDIDTAWTMDHSCGKGVTALESFNGKLYVATVAAAGVRGLVLVRDSAGAYTTSDTGAGGATAILNNGFLALHVHGTELLASYWNAETPNISYIDGNAGSSWSTVYTGASGTLKPFTVFFSDNGVVFAIAASPALVAALISSPTGLVNTWTDLTAELPESTKAFTPVVGAVVL